uniref:Reverse transcriptase domain-containing protein n=1 Tax=Meloidogyne javanica TaxID=6303 RepID=A0A915M777_MELJA
KNNEKKTKDNGKGDKDNTDSSEQQLEREALRAEFWRAYHRTKGKMERKALRINVGKVKASEWVGLGICVRECVDRHARKYGILKVLNTAVYSAGKTLEARTSVSRKEAQKAFSEWKNDRKKECERIRVHIGWITDEIRRRKSKSEPTFKQRRNFLDLQRCYQVGGRPIRSTKDLMAKNVSLKVHLKLLKDRIDLRCKKECEAVEMAKPLRRKLEEPRGESKLKSADDARKYWSGIVGKEKAFEKTPELTSWAEAVREKTTKGQQFSNYAEDLRRWNNVLKKARPTKAPGPDGIPNLLWKRLIPANKVLFDWFMGIKKHKLRFPNWLTEGRVVLLPKGDDPSNPANYRPIACLNTMYKLLTGVMTTWIGEHLTAHGILPYEQRALVKDTWGCTHATILDRTITSHAKATNTPLAAVWIDFAKAFDSVSQLWIRYALRAINIQPNIRHAIGELMRGWSVRYELMKNGKIIQSNKLRVRNGVLQGDSMSPLLYCLAIAPISHNLKTLPKYKVSVPGQDVTINLNHLFYMDDFKGFAPSNEYLREIIEKTRGIARSLGLEFNTKKCAWIPTEIRGEEAVIELPTLGSKAYTYLGVEESLEVDFDQAWNRIKERMVVRVKKLLKTEKTWGTFRTGYSTCVMPVGRFLYMNTVVGGPSWIKARDLATEFDGTVRKLLRQKSEEGTKGWRFYSACSSRLYVETASGGLGLKSLTEVLYEGIVYCWSYIQCKDDLEIARILFGSRARKGISESVTKGFKKLVLRPMKLSEEIMVPAAEGNEAVHGKKGLFVCGQYHDNATKGARAIMKLVKTKINEVRLEIWKSLPMAGQVINSPIIDNKLSFHWLQKAKVGRTVFRNCIAAQEGALKAVELFRKGQTETDVTCRRCKGARESVQHILSGCPVYRTGLMLERHNNVVNQLHATFRRRFDLPKISHNQPIPAVMESDSAKIFYDVRLFTRNVRAALKGDENEIRYEGLHHDRPDLVIFDKTAGKIHIVEVCVAWYENL